jgi:hypothetical protein
LNPDSFAVSNNITKWIERMDDISCFSKLRDSQPSNVLGKLTSLKNYKTFKELFVTYLHQFRSVADRTPLSYIIRKDINGTAEQRTALYNTVDDDLIMTASHSTASYRTDNETVFDLLKPFVIDGEGWAHILQFNNKHIGLKSWDTLEVHAKANPKQRGGKNKKQKTSSSLTKHYTAEEWGKLAVDEHTRIMKLSATTTTQFTPKISSVTTTFPPVLLQPVAPKIVVPECVPDVPKGTTPTVSNVSFVSSRPDPVWITKAVAASRHKAIIENQVVEARFISMVVTGRPVIEILDDDDDDIGFGCCSW